MAAPCMFPENLSGPSEHSTCWTETACFCLPFCSMNSFFNTKSPASSTVLRMVLGKNLLNKRKTSGRIYSSWRDPPNPSRFLNENTSCKALSSSSQTDETPLLKGSGHLTYLNHLVNLKLIQRKIFFFFLQLNGYETGLSGPHIPLCPEHTND